jgi:ubiquinone/menaquinone biosynthesis C-methylase UbiE
MADNTTPDRDYVLGTHDDELERLGLQHRVWQPWVIDAWKRAGFSPGQTLLDLGCGPGYATVDLASIAGRSGKVIGIDRSRRFLDRLDRVASEDGLHSVETHEIDLDTDDLPEMLVDGVWCRWVLGFLKNPRRMIDTMARVIRPGGTFVSHEYFAYETWRFLPPSAELTEFVKTVMSSWRATGGEPEVGLELPAWLAESGFEIVEVRPLIHMLTSADEMWRWPISFVSIASERWVEIGTMTRERAEEIRQAIARREREPNVFMATPGVVEIIARRQT